MRKPRRNPLLPGKDELRRIRGVWVKMRRRCHNENDPAYQWYGGRGIEVCPEWRDSSRKFREWAIPAGWMPGLQIDRRDNDKGYSPENCRWVTGSVNAQNRRKKRGSASSYVGVSRVGTQWQAFIQRDGKRRRIVWAATEEEAARAYDAAAIELYGPDAKVNFPRKAAS